MSGTDDKLDTLSMSYFEVLQELLEERQKLELSMRNGFLELAKSRQNMGSMAVCSLQLPSPTSDKCHEADYKVDRFVVERNSLETVSFYQQQMQMNAAEEPSDQTGGLRKRIQAKDGFNNEVKVTKTNSMKWFGILLPNSLKISKQQFESSLNSVCKVASLEVTLQQILDEYQKIKQSS